MGNQWLVTSGLTSGDRLIVEGLQRARPNMVVKPVPAGANLPLARQAPGARPARAHHPPARRAERPGTAHYGLIFHRPPHLRVGAGHRHHAGRWCRRAVAAAERYPDIAPTRVSVNTSFYPGASAQTIELGDPDRRTKPQGYRRPAVGGKHQQRIRECQHPTDLQRRYQPGHCQVRVQNKVQGIISRLPQAVQARAFA